MSCSLQQGRPELWYEILPNPLCSTDPRKIKSQKAIKQTRSKFFRGSQNYTELFFFPQVVFLNESNRCMGNVPVGNSFQIIPCGYSDLEKLTKQHVEQPEGVRTVLGGMEQITNNYLAQSLIRQGEPQIILILVSY